jgi:hypothetical protein
MESEPAPPDADGTNADGSHSREIDEHEIDGSDYGAQNTFRSRKRTKFVSQVAN